VAALPAPPGGASASPTITASFLSLIKSALGTPYLWGGTNPFAGGADCSGLIYWAAGKLGLSVPRTSEAMWASLPHVPASQVQAGDLVFFPGSDGTSSAPGHVGIVTGPGEMIDDPYTGQVVRYDSYSTSAKGIGQVVGFARIPTIGGTSGAAAGAGSGAAGSGGGASAWQTIWAGIVGGLDFSAASGGQVATALQGAAAATDPTEQGLLALAAPFIKLAEGLDWLFHPSSWIRILAGVTGGILVLGGTFQMFHTGGEIPVSAYGVSTSVGIPRAASLPLGILFTGLGGLLLFVAFHNLPGDVDSFPSFIGFLTDEISGGTKTAATG
jgi:hypothetical protein